MKKIIVLSVFYALFCSVAAADTPRSHVLLISIDGLVPDVYLDREKAAAATPNLAALARRGVAADQVVTVFPSVTYPAHATMVTGTNPATHRVSSNFQPGTTEWLANAADIKGTTLWHAAKQAGLTTAAVMWPMTYGADVNWLVTESSQADRRDAGLHAALQRGSTKGLLARLAKQAGALPADGQSEDDTVQAVDRMSAAYAAQILKDEKPDLTLVYFLEADHMQHAHGPGSTQAASAFKHIDAHIGTLLSALKTAGIEERTNVIVVGDHGFAPVHTALNVNRLLLDLGYARIEQGRLINDLVRFDSQAGSGAFYSLPGASAQALAEFGQRLEALVNSRYRTLVDYVSAQQLRELGGYPGAIAALSAAPGYMLVPLPVPHPAVATHHNRGMHGYLPDMPDMATGLIAAGPAFQSGVRPPVLRLLDVAPTIGALLGLALPAAEGSAIVGILNTPADPRSPL